jgi:4a-hydroxytetrahydrobiopterin dehydratase
MSEEGWREFLAAEDLDDWVVLHGGAAAAYRVGSLEEGAALAAAFAAVPRLGPRTFLTISPEHVTVRLNRDVWGLEPEHIDLARAVSEIAREFAAVADRAAVQEVQLAIAAQPEDIELGFWRAVLGYAPLADDNAIDPLGHSSTVWMQDLDPAKQLRHAMHIDVSVAREHVHQRVEAAIEAGGRVVVESDSLGSWILADRAGNKVCVTAWPDGSEPT